MVQFQLRSQQTGESKTFSLLDMLRILGDTTNNEIRFPDGNREDVFNLSSFIDKSGNTDNFLSGTKIINEAVTVQHNQQSIQLGHTPQTLCMIYLNGIKLRQGIDYTKEGRNIHLLFPLIVNNLHSDLIEALYDV